MRIVLLSDTHHLFAHVEVPPGDLLVHTGDHSQRGTVAEVSASASWLRGLPHRHKVVLAGNHDFCLQRAGTEGHEMFAGMTYLLDQAVEIEGLRIYGSPWTPRFGEWAYQLERGEPIAESWRKIPDDTQMLLTHGPPAGIGDLTVRGQRAGCRDLMDRVYQVKPLLHVYGHIHEGYGQVREGGTLFVNASICSFGYTHLQPVQVFDWDGRDFQPVHDGPG